MDNLKKNLDSAKATLGPDPLKFAVILGSGTFAPVHKAHTGMFEVAKEKLTKAGFTVIGGFMSPCCDRYAQYKLQKDFIPAQHRSGA